MSNKQVIVNNLYLGPIEIWSHLLNSNEIILECQEHYQKKSFRNKCEILCSSGVELLSIPLKKGKHRGVNIKEVAIAYEDPWTSYHLKKIKDAYIKAPYYEHYIAELASIFEKNHSYLYDLNFALLEWSLSILKLDILISETNTYEKNPSDSILDLRSLSNIKMKGSILSRHHYPQVYEYKMGFKANLSILDLIMNQGPESSIYLKQLAKK